MDGASLASFSSLMQLLSVSGAELENGQGPLDSPPPGAVSEPLFTGGAPDATASQWDREAVSEVDSGPASSFVFPVIGQLPRWAAKSVPPEDAVGPRTSDAPATTLAPSLLAAGGGVGSPPNSTDSAGSEVDVERAAIVAATLSAVATSGVNFALVEGGVDFLSQEGLSKPL